MIKCPKCNGTRMYFSTLPTVTENDTVLTTHWCSCGCVFRRTYILNDSHIIATDIKKEEEEND